MGLKFQAQKAAKQVAAFWNSISTFVSATPLDIFMETLGKLQLNFSTIKTEKAKIIFLQPEVILII